MILAIKMAVIAILAYLLGSVPFGLIVSKVQAHIDIRKYGSGNIGATNVLRTLGFKAALPVMILDVGKGALAVYLSTLIIGDESIMLLGYDVHMQAAQVVAALLAMAGHNWSIFLKFKGGKGVATFLGGLSVISLPLALIGGIIGLAIALITKYVSLGSLLGSLAVLLSSMIEAVVSDIQEMYVIYLMYALVAVMLIFYQHRANIKRLQAGQELKLGQGSSKLEL